MKSSRTILKNLKNINQYLGQFPQSQQPTYFEQLIAETFSHILHLPFFTNDNDNSNIPHRITWKGSVNSNCRSPQGNPDAIACCFDFYLIVEATINTGANQWAREFAPSIRHCENFCNQKKIEPNDIFVLIVCTNLHKDTYQSIKNNPTHEYKVIPIEVSNIAKILETSVLAFTMRHTEMRKLLHQISDCIKTSSSLVYFRNTVDSLLTTWQKEVLKLEKSAFVGVKSYEAMKKINRTHIGTSEILQKLQRHPTVNKYLKIIDDKLSPDVIEESLDKQNLASQFSSTYDEKVFYPIPFIDFKERALRIIKAVEVINGQFKCK